MQLELLILAASSSLKPFHVTILFLLFIKFIGYNGVIKLVESINADAQGVGISKVLVLLVYLASCIHSLLIEHFQIL